MKGSKRVDHWTSGTVCECSDIAGSPQGSPPAADYVNNDQSRLGHQCSETTLTGESQFHKSTPLGIGPGSLMTGSKRVDHWTSGTVCECSDITGSPHDIRIGACTVL
jgi:hypothetical protein